MSTISNVNYTGVKDRITVWGLPDCTGCKRVTDFLISRGFGAVGMDIEKQLINEPPLIRDEVMMVYTFECSLPVVQVNDLAFSPKDAFKFLGIKEEA